MRYNIHARIDGEEFVFVIRDNARFLWLLPNTGGITLGKNMVFVKRRLRDAIYLNYHIVEHEAVHVRQAHRLGWKYLPTYILQAIKAWFVKDNIPMEREAYDMERKVYWTIRGGDFPLANENDAID